MTESATCGGAEHNDGILRRMKTRLNLKPGQKGAGKLSAQYGDRLLCVRYRYDEERKKRLKTVELITEETDWEPKVAEKAVNDAAPSVQVSVSDGERRIWRES